MINFDFSIYKNNKQYFLFYDVILKNEPTNKDAFLESLGIIPSSYRRSRMAEQKVGIKIIDTLNLHYNLQQPTDEFLDELENRFSSIYFDLYFKNYLNFEKDCEYVDSLLDKKFNIYPIIYLMKLFMVINSQKNGKKLLQDYKDMYLEVIRYKNFFTQQLLDILDLIVLSFEDEITKEMLAKTYTNGLAYFIIASKLSMKKRFIESLYYAEYSKSYLERENNYKRMIFLNLTKMFNYNCIGNYQECYELAHRQLIMLYSFSIITFEFASTIKHLSIACLALKKYEETIHFVEMGEQYTLTDLACFLVSKYYTNLNDYHKELNEYLNDNIGNIKLTEFLNNLDNYLNYKDKTSLQNLEKFNLYSCLPDLLKCL